MRARTYLALVVLALGLGACGGATTPTSMHKQPAPGAACQDPGQVAPAEDGCNTCTCTESGWTCTLIACGEPGACRTGDTKDDGCNACTCDDGAWSCTEKACSGESCTTGSTKPAEDGCNTCTCTDDGEWACTERACDLGPVAECPEPLPLGDAVLCSTVVVYGRSEETGACCLFPTPCQVPEGFTPYYTQEECEVGAAEPVCSPGQTKDARDGCNTCLCSERGQWICTLIGCVELEGCGARFGDTCGKDEYCAYEAGQQCGAADASAVCKPRPEACTKEYAPVCGCDGKTYGNACAAAAAGTGVLSTDACPTDK